MILYYIKRFLFWFFCCFFFLLFVSFWGFFFLSKLYFQYLNIASCLLELYTTEFTKCVYNYLKLSLLINKIIFSFYLWVNYLNNQSLFCRSESERSDIVYIFKTKIEYYTNIPCDCGRYTRIFSRGTNNCMDVLYCPTPTAEGNITHPCNSMSRGKMFLYIDHNHMEYLLYYNLIVK